MSKRRLPIRVACPYGERWAEMRPEAGGRSCGRCDRHLVDLSLLTEAQVGALLERSRGRVCAKIDRDVDGEPIFAQRAVRRLVSTAAGVVMSVSVAACGAEPAEQPVPAQTEQPASVEAVPSEPPPEPEPPVVEPEVAERAQEADEPAPTAEATAPEADEVEEPEAVTPEPVAAEAPPRRRPRARRRRRRAVDQEPLVGLVGL